MQFNLTVAGVEVHGEGVAILVALTWSVGPRPWDFLGEVDGDNSVHFLSVRG